jgi:hypothetical protein
MPWIRIEGITGSQEELNPRSSLDVLGFAVIVMIVISVAGVLSMVATWFIDTYLPIPGGDAGTLGLLGFLFVLFITIPFAVSKLEQGNGIEAIRSSLTIFLLGLITGLITAVAVGSLLLFWRRHVAAIPWVQEIPWDILPLLLVFAYGLWIRRDDQKYSWKWLIVEGSFLIFLVTSNLLAAVSGFSGGKAWLGTIDLAIALLFGLLAATAFVKAWRIWRRRERPGDGIA